MPSLERMLLAFRYHYTQLIVAADDQLFKAELPMLASLDVRMKALDLMDHDGVLYEDFAHVFQTALRNLPDQLTEREKRDLVRELFLVARADGLEQVSEYAAVREAADALGLSEAGFAAARA